MEDEKNPNEDQVLIANARKDRRAFNVLYQKYVQPVYRYQLNRIGAPAEAEDATAQTFLAALEGLPRYRDDGHFAAWLFGIARRKATDHFRQQRRQTTLQESTPSFDEDLLTSAEQHERLDGLRVKLRGLPEDEQELLRLRYAAQLSFAEIGKLMHLSEDAVKKRLYRMLERLHAQMEANND